MTKDQKIPIQNFNNLDYIRIIIDLLFCKIN